MNKLTNLIQFTKEMFLFLIMILLFSRGFIFVDSLYFLFPVLLLILSFLGIQNMRQVLLKRYEIITYLPFICLILLSTLWSKSGINTLARSSYFVLILVGMYAFSSLMKESKLNSIRLFFPVILVTLLLTTFSYILKFPKEYWSGGNGLGLMGFATHQNTLGSMMLIFTSVLNVMLFIEYERKSETKNKLFFLVFVNIIALVILSITFSRGAILSYLVFGFFYLVLSSGFKKTIISIITLVIIILLLSRIGVINNFLDYTVFKSADNLLSSREAMYKGSFEAAKNGGLFGLGYGISDPSITDGVPGNYIKGVFVREKGSTILALVEETGIVGAILFYLPVALLLWKGGGKLVFRVKTLRQAQCDVPFGKLYEKDVKSEKSFLISVIIAMTVHSQVEAWGVGVGSIMLPVYLFFIFRLSAIIKI